MTQRDLDLIYKPFEPVRKDPPSLRTVGICAAIMIGIWVAGFAAIYLSTGVL